MESILLCRARVESEAIRLSLIIARYILLKIVRHRFAEIIYRAINCFIFPKPLPSSSPDLNAVVLNLIFVRSRIARGPSAFLHRVRSVVT